MLTQLQMGVLEPSMMTLLVSLSLLTALPKVLTVLFLIPKQSWFELSWVKKDHALGPVTNTSVLIPASPLAFILMSSTSPKDPPN